MRKGFARFAEGLIAFFTVFVLIATPTPQRAMAGDVGEVGEVVDLVLSFRESASPLGFAEPLGEIQALIKQLIEETRPLTFDPSSPLLYELGLEAAVEQPTEQIQEQHRILSNFEDDGQPKPLDEDVPG